MVPRREPLSKIIYSDSIQADPQTFTEVVEPESSSTRHFLLVLLILFGFATFVAGAIYWYQTRHFPVVVAISPPDTRNNDGVGKPAPLVPLGPDMLHVTSIALGNPPLAIVNGKRLAEEDWLVVKTPSGEVSVRVVLIQDGYVRFKHGGETIDARLQIANGSPSP